MGYLHLEEEGIKSEDSQLLSLILPQYPYTVQRKKNLLSAPGQTRFNVIDQTSGR